jgi:UDP-2-acetamido-2,6-beta-L-arabino-hexul-4-ose reductase
MKNNLLKIGITGQAGFVGTHLFNQLGLAHDLFERVSFEDSFFSETELLEEFVKACDVIIHLAAVNRNQDPEELYRTNVALVESLITAMEKQKVAPLILFSSSIQEKLDNPYGRSKLKGRKLLEAWANKNNASFSGLLVPNVYGPFCRPNYNSFVATFSWKLTHGEQPEIVTDSSVKLIYITSLCSFIITHIQENQKKTRSSVQEIEIPFDFEDTVSSILAKMNRYKEQYFIKGIIPVLETKNDINLFNTFRSYINYETHFPVKLTLHTDPRGSFVETIRLGVGGQVSFSTTKPGITRGNHFHIRKIERFIVIKGKAQIQLRKIGTDEVINFILDGKKPSYVDMPIWYTHNIKNIGTEDLYTQFWINEWYDEADPDTYFELV